MKLPVIKHLNTFIAENDADYIEEAITVLEHVSESKAIKDNELDVIGELLSNMYGALEVRKIIASGQTEKDALNQFMQRVMGAIDK